MTKEDKLTWRLKDLPTADEVASLVEANVITPQEARDLLFNKKQSKDIVVENNALKEQVEYLQSLVDKLVSRNNWSNIGYATIVKEFVPRYPTTYWVNTDKVYGMGENTLTMNVGSTKVLANYNGVTGASSNLDIGDLVKGASLTETFKDNITS